MSDSEKVKLAIPPPDRRAALRDAVRERDTIQKRVHHAQAAEKRGHELLDAADANLTSFGDVDAAVLNHRADKIKRAAMGGPSPDMNLPAVLIKRKAARDEALEHVAAIKVAHESLVVDLGHAQNALRRAEQHVCESATAILVEEGAVIAAALRAAWNSVWASYDELNALSGCWLPFAEGSRPPRLPADLVSTLQFIAALDHRQHPGGKNVAFNRASQHWRRWHETLCKDVDAAKRESGDDSSSSADTKRVA
jgi:hypothetical protein